MDSFTLSVMYQTAVCKGGNSVISQGPEAETLRGRNDIIVYPNPTNGLLNITYQLNKDATFILYDIVGREIMKTTLSAKNNKATIELKNTPIGIYTYSIKDENNINKVGKLEVQ